VKAILATLALVVAAPVLAAEPPPGSQTVEHSAWELDLFVGYGQQLYPAPKSSTDGWWNGGPAFAIDVAYRGPHFTHPFLELSWVPILSSGQAVYLPGTNGTSSVSNSANALGLVIGPGWDIDWFRVRVGIGGYDVMTSTTVDGVKDSSSGIVIGYMAALAAQVWRPDPFALGIEARFVGLMSPTSGFYQGFWQVGLTGRWDFSRK
jgi:opacity protein-like surface antigen